MNTPRRKPVTTTRETRSSRLSTLHIIAIIWAIMMLGIVCAIFFAPKREAAPPPSKLEYEQRPDAKKPAQSGSSEDMAWPKPKGDAPSPAMDPAKAEAAMPYTITGVVTAAGSGERLAGIRVAAEYAIEMMKPGDPQALPDDKTPIIQNGTTDAEGRYVIRTSEPVGYWIEASGKGYCTSERTPVQFVGEEKALTLDFVLERGATVSGRVTVYGSGEGAKGVRVFVEQQGNIRTTTGEDGKYELTGLRPGDWAIRITTEDAAYEVRGEADAQNVTITSPAQHIMNMDFVVDAAGVVWGYIMNPEKQPVNGVSMILCTSDSIVSQIVDASVRNKGMRGGNSDEKGYYQIVGVPLNKEFMVYASCRDFSPQLSDPFLVTATHREARMDLFLTQGTTVYGKVVSTDGAPIPEANVLCIPAYGQFFSPLNTPQAMRDLRSEADGSFVIAQIPAGEYQVMAQKDGFKFAAMGEPIYPDGRSDIKGVQVTLAPVNSGEHEVFGRVVNSDGAPVPGASLELAMMSGEELTAGSLNATTTETGEFRFTGVTPGILVLTARKEGYSPKNVTNVKIDAATNITLDVVSSLRGVVLVRETGKPPQGGNVRAIPEEGSDGAQKPGIGGLMAMANSSEASIQADGAFEMQLAAGSYVLEARAPGFTPTKQNVEIGAGEQVENVKLYVTEAGGRITGSVVSPDGQPLASALVWIVEGKGGGLLGDIVSRGERRGQHTGPDGRFEFKSLPAGSYQVQAQYAGFAQGVSEQVSVREGGSAANITLTLHVGGALEGLVLQQGQPQSGAIVTAMGGGVTETTTSDANGRYRIEHLPEGSFLASAFVVGIGQTAGSALTPLHGQVQIVEGQTTTYNFGENAGAALVGICDPPPKPGAITYGMLHVPGMPGDINQIDFSNPAAWLTDQSGAGAYMMGNAQIGLDGQFRMENLVKGSYVLDIYQLDTANIAAGGVRLVYSMNVEITGEQETQITVPLPDIPDEGEETTQ